jgi:hypothetical protein
MPDLSFRMGLGRELIQQERGYQSGCEARAGRNDAGDPELRNPITGVACCARAATGHAAAAPPSSDMNSRRFI